MLGNFVHFFFCLLCIFFKLTFSKTKKKIFQEFCQSVKPDLSPKVISKQQKSPREGGGGGGGGGGHRAQGAGEVNVKDSYICQK